MKPTQYIAGDRRGRAAHDIELEAMRDPFLAEALEGLEAVEGDHTVAMDRLQKRLTKRTSHKRGNRWRLSVAAALLAIAATTALLTLRRPAVPEADSSAVATTTPAPQGSADARITASPSKGSAEAGTTTIPKGFAEGQEPANRTRATKGSVVTRQQPGAVARRIRGRQEQDSSTLLPVYVIDGPGHKDIPSTAPNEIAALRVAKAENGERALITTKQAELLAQVRTDARHEPDREPEADWELETEWEPGMEPQQNAGDITGRGIDIRDVAVVAFGTGKKSAFVGTAGDKKKQLEKELDQTIKTGTETPVQIVASPAAAEEIAFVCAETMPSFEGGDFNSFRKWVAQRIRKPEIALECGISGRMVVSFVIDTLGNLGDIRVLQSPDRSLTEEAIRVLRTSPRWEPGRQRDRKVPVKYTMPVDFRRQN